MAGRRLLDAALLFSASRAIARQHFRIRGEQLDVWSRTSTIAKAVGLRRVNAADLQPSHPPQPHIVQTQRADEAETVPRQESVEGQQDVVQPAEGLKQDHHYKRSEENTANEPVHESELGVKQEKPANIPTPDGTIPPQGAPIATPKAKPVNADVVPGRLDAEPQHPSAQEQTSSTPVSAPQEKIPSHEAVPEQDEVPEGVNTDVFHSPRVAKMLGGRTNDPRRMRMEDLRMQGATGTPLQQTNMNQDTFNVRNTQADQAVHVKSMPEQPQASSQPIQQQTPQTDSIQDLAASIASEATAASPDATAEAGQSVEATNAGNAYEMRESSVPSSRFGRLWQYAGLGTSMAFGAVGETFRRATGTGGSGSLMLSERNMERLVAKLSRMRGAALKLGQMMSFQDSKMLPAPIAEVLRRVQDNADYMPAWQRNRVLSSNLGADWSSLFTSFSEKPIAAASIGQVHRATLAASNTPVAVKIQYPGVATSISSDLNNLSVLLTASRLLPRGLYLDKTIANARTELAWECDYTREATCQARFRDLLVDETDTFTVPAVISEASGPTVLTAEFMSGVGVTKASLNLTQAERDHIGTQILRLCLRELTEFKFMQTDPNWTNFLYNRADKGSHGFGKLELLDFGASREFPDEFVDPYVCILKAASKGDRETIRDLSVQLGYLTGHESAAMTDAHVMSVLTLAEPFTEAADEVYDFREQTVTDRVRGLIPVMVRERLAPPPEETYSLHRKLSGAFLMLARLGSRVRCRELFVDAVGKWEKRKGSAV